MLFPKKFLGIDIGTSYIKMVELSRFGSRKKLENYGELSASSLYQQPFRTFEKNTLFLLGKDISRALKAIIEESRIKSRDAIFSIPDFSTFFTTFDLPPMTKNELEEAVKYEAKLHIPMPLGEVALDYIEIEGAASEKKETNLKILLVAVPNEVINQYREIAENAKLRLVALEAEVFGLVRALVDEDEKRPIAIIDIGSQSTTCNIVEKRILKASHSFDVSGNELAKVISQSFTINMAEAEKAKNKYGILGPGAAGVAAGYKIREILLPLIDVLMRETEIIFNNFSTAKNKEIQKIILAGGTAYLPGLKEYFMEKFNKEVEIANPFSNIFYPPILEKTVKDMGPGYAIATGMALRGLEY
jgi:type IV pilus assembly protein PilM